MVIDVYSGFNKKLNSTKQPSTPRASLTVRLKNPTSVLNPVFLVTGYNLADNYVKWGSRYYFIDDIVIVGNELAEYHCSTDVLATFKSLIGSSSQYILRSASTFDGSITDMFYPMKAQKSASRSKIASGFVFPQLGTFVVGVQGRTSGESFGSTTYYCMDIYNASAFMDGLFNIANSEYDATNVENVSGIPEAVYKSLINPQQYIVSCMYLPFEYETIGSTSTSVIRTGWYDISASALIFDPSFDSLPTIEHTLTLSKHPQNARGVYMNNAPFTEYVLSYMPFGEIPLPADLLLNQTQIHTKLIVDVLTGMGTLKIYAGSDDSGQLLESRSAQVGVSVAISGGVYDTSKVGTISKGITGALVGSMLAGREGTGFFSGVKDGIADSMQSPTISTSGSNGALDFLEYDVVLYSRFNHVVDDDNTQHGRPLCSVRTINTLSGYIQCLRPDLDVPASRSEKTEIVNFMEGGFYYE